MFRAFGNISLPQVCRLNMAVVIGLALSNLGCGTGPQAEFKFREATQSLIPEAKQAVEKTLSDGFGSPNELVAWERFPIIFGGTKGSVTAVEGESGLVVAMDTHLDAFKKPLPIVWIAGSLAGKDSAEGTASKYDPANNQLTLANGAKPAVGDRFIVGFGHEFQMGRQVYMRNCMHCHGVTGDGNGPTGEFLNPRPRDYRNGQFKFTSTKPGEKASREDLERIIEQGVPGTYMPSFLLLGEKETKAVVEYIRWLAIRGEFEKRLATELAVDFSEKTIKETNEKAHKSYADKIQKKEEATEPPTLEAVLKSAASDFATFLADDYPASVEDTADFLASSWTKSDEPDTLVVPATPRVEDTPASRERGRLLYMSDRTKCYTCHGFTGRGDGTANEDFWPKPGSSDKYPNPGLHDEWGYPLKPRNLTQGQYRGGRRPVDVFRRMYAGIKGTPMPAFGGSALKDDEIWDIVNFVMSLPYTKLPNGVAESNAVNLEEKTAH